VAGPTRQAVCAPKSLTAALVAYLDDAHHPPKWPTQPAGAPAEYAFIELAKQYGQDPLIWPYQHDILAVMRFINIVAAAAKATSDNERVGNDSTRLGD
jgi:hypothetical protein